MPRIPYPATGLALALSPLLAGVSVSAASQDSRASALEEVVVTARRVEESLQDVPVAVTALTRNTLEALRIDSFLTVGQTVPNVYIQKQGGSPTAPQMNIRGVSNGSLNMQVDSGIGLYVDGVYIGRSGAAAFDMADLERVEVMRGPQGTLFGRNSTGGAINLITSKPTGDADFGLDFTVGNFNHREYRARIDTAEWNGFSARLVAGHVEYDGDVENLSAERTFHFDEPFGSYTTNSRGGDSDTDNVYVAINYAGIERLTVDYKFDYSNWKGTMNYRQMGSFGPCVDFDATPGQCIIGNGLVDPVQPFNLSFDYQDELAVPLESGAEQITRGHSLTAEFEISDSLAIRYIGGYREYQLDAGMNQVWGASEYVDTAGIIGGVPGGLYAPLLALRKENQDQFSNEIQLIGSGDSLEWIIGAFQFEEEGAVNTPIFLSQTFSDGQFIPIDVAAFHYFVGQNIETSNESIAAYAHLTLHLGDFDLSGGVRYTEDDREEYIIAAGLYGAVLPGNQTFDYSDDHLDYDASLTYNFGESSNVYAKYATGYVSGGSLAGNAFDQDEMELYELGIKSDFLDHTLRFNAAVFRQERTDVQIEGFTSIGYFMGIGEDITADGIELEATWIPTTGLSLNASWGYTDVDSSGDLRTFQPENTAYLGAQYDFPGMANGIETSFRVDWSWRDEVHRLACIAGQDQVPATDICAGTPDYELDDAATIGAVDMVSANLVFANIPLGDTTRLRATLWGRNLLDENEIEFNFTLGGPTITNTFIRPRTYGVDLSIDF
ncbi:TonB-dependent receptor [Parahaliea aestuarii]|uniref:TonB-dependent receptor n=1 Tax=Parahaliea aestuarii TaxID=1852021 RepID=A0A5C8ZVL5_9GAMM|nr:TonB-dependent receptor [Parahaliea aestuarii]TXS91794.1 TonB-dependent receptor [Parahaliea aestuarii]